MRKGFVLAAIAIALTSGFCFGQDAEISGALTLSVTTERGDSGVYGIGEDIVLLVSVNKPVWLRLYHIDAEGKAKLLWPNPYVIRGIVDPGEGIRFPNLRDRFVLRVEPPTGTERILAVASTRPLYPNDPLLPSVVNPESDPGAYIPRGLTKAELYPPERVEASVSFEVREKSLQPGSGE